MAGAPRVTCNLASCSGRGTGLFQVHFASVFLGSAPLAQLLGGWGCGRSESVEMAPRFPVSMGGLGGGRGATW